MTGHSKWAQIQFRKKNQYAQRGKIFTRMIREISMATQQSGEDTNINPRLRLAIEKANAANMPNESIQLAISNGLLDSHSYEDVIYEGFAFDDIAIMIECVTDNKKRTDDNIKKTFTDHAVNLGAQGSVSYLFTKLGELCFAPGSYENTITNVAIEADADDVVVQDDGTIEVFTTETTYVNVIEAMKAADLTPDFADITMHASAEVELDKHRGSRLVNFITDLEALADTQHVYHNADIPPESYE